MKKQNTLIAFLMVQLVSAISFAGSWEYGCSGKLPSGDSIFFNRGSLVIADTKLAVGDVKNLERPTLDTYESDDINSGLEKKLTFSHLWGDKSVTKVILTELSSKKTHSKEESVPCTGNRGRDIIHTNYLKQYELKHDENEAGGTKIKMNCFEYEVSACG